MVSWEVVRRIWFALVVSACYDPDLRPIAAMGSDGAIDAVLVDAPEPLCPPGQVHCEGSCTTGVDCLGCGSYLLFCRSTRACLTDCSACPAVAGSLAIECYVCVANDRADPASTIATCEPTGPSNYCLNGDYGTAYRAGLGHHCDCSGGNVSACAGAAQVCVPAGSTDWCSTCGEANTHDLPCKGGGMCDTTSVPPGCH